MEIKKENKEEEMIKLIDIYKDIKFIKEAKITPRDLIKPTKSPGLSDRGEVLLKMINSKNPLTLMNGEEITIDIEKSKNFITNLQNKDYKSLLKIPFFDKNGNNYFLGNLKKTASFGGQDISRGMSTEDAVLQNLLNQINEVGGKVDIKIGNTVYKNIVSGYKPNKNPKADFILYDDLDDDKIFISHKDYPNFQQYSGVAKLKNNYPEVQSFIDDIKELTGGQLKKGQGFERNIQDDNLKIESVYGSGDSYGLNKVQILCIGDIKLEKLGKDNLYSLKAVETFNDLEIPTGRYEPKLSCSWRESHNQQGIKNARLGIYADFHFPTAKKI